MKDPIMIMTKLVMNDGERWVGEVSSCSVSGHIRVVADRMSEVRVENTMIVGVKIGYQ